MLSRKQFKLIQTVRGLSADEIIAKSGIPPQSFMVLMESDGSDGRDASKLISDSTYRRLALTFGLEPDMNGLRMSSVIEWRFTPKARREWQEAVRTVRQELFTETVDMAVLTHPVPFYSRKPVIVFLHDLGTDVKLAITAGDMRMVRFLQGVFGVSPRTVVLDSKEFQFTRRLLENGVYRSNQFHMVLGGRKVRYSWGEVKAAAKEFNFTTDELIDLMVVEVHARLARESDQDTAESEVPSVEGTQKLRLAAA